MSKCLWYNWQQMGSNRQQGFTIIETLIVLTISSLLAIGIITGLTSVINRQRYSESVSNLTAWVQQQYIATTRVSNPERTEGTWYSCDTNAVAQSTTSVNADTKPRGQSDCKIIGRVINLNVGGSNGTRTEAAYVMAYRSNDDTAPLPEGDMAALKAYKLRLYNGTNAFKETYELPWGAAIREMGGSPVARNGAIIILQSPVSGSVLTFISDTSVTSTTQIENLLVAANLKSLTLCVDPNGLVVVGAVPRNGVVIHQSAAGPNGVERIEDGSGC